MTYAAYKQLQRTTLNSLAQTATLTATTITLIKFKWLSLSNPTQRSPTQLMDGPNPCASLICMTNEQFSLNRGFNTIL